MERNFLSKHYVAVQDAQNKILTSYLFNLSGQIVGYQQYRPDSDKTKRNNPKDGRYYTYISKGQFAIWGLETFHWNNEVLFIVEGIFDAVRIHNLGYPCIAVLSNNPKPLKGWLKTINRKILGVCDPEASGKYMMKYCDKYYIMDDHDLGDASEEEVKKIVEELLCY